MCEKAWLIYAKIPRANLISLDSRSAAVALYLYLRINILILINLSLFNIRDGHYLDFSKNRFSFDYRYREHATTTKTSAYLMFRRNERTRYEFLKPDV